MATENEIRGAFAKVSANFPVATHETRGTLRLVLETWLEVLADAPAPVLSAAVRQVLSEPREWRPTPGQVRAVCLAITQPARPSPVEACKQAEGWRIGELSEPADDLVRMVAERFAWWHWRDEPEITRGSFMKCYREALEVDREERKLCPAAVACREAVRGALPEPAKQIGLTCSTCGDPDAARAHDDRGRCMRCVAEARERGEFAGGSSGNGSGRGLERAGGIAAGVLGRIGGRA